MTTPNKNSSNCLVEIDFSQLEICVAAWLSQDPVLLKELKDGVDIHAENQKAFGLPSRLIAKIFVFRLLYGGNAFSFAKDPAFFKVSKSPKYWSEVINKFYNKYKGINTWHLKLIREVTNKGYYENPFGRRFSFNLNKYKDYPTTDIKNYIVQGTGADIIMLLRNDLFTRFPYLLTKFKGTVHDSLLFEIKETELQYLKAKLNVIFIDLCNSINKLKNSYDKNILKDWELSCKYEVKVGKDWKNLVKES